MAALADRPMEEVTRASWLIQHPNSALLTVAAAFHYAREVMRRLLAD